MADETLSLLAPPSARSLLELDRSTVQSFALSCGPVGPKSQKHSNQTIVRCHDKPTYSVDRMRLMETRNISARVLAGDLCCSAE